MRYDYIRLGVLLDTTDTNFTNRSLPQPQESFTKTSKLNFDQSITMRCKYSTQAQRSHRFDHISLTSSTFQLYLQYSQSRHALLNLSPYSPPFQISPPPPPPHHTTPSSSPAASDSKSPGSAVAAAAKATAPPTTPQAELRTAEHQATSAPPPTPSSSAKAPVSGRTPAARAPIPRATASRASPKAPGSPSRATTSRPRVVISSTTTASTVNRSRGIRRRRMRGTRWSMSRGKQCISSGRRSSLPDPISRRRRARAR